MVVMPSISQIGRGLLGGAQRVIRQAVLATALPATAVSNIGSKALSGGKSLFNFAKTFTTQKTVNPLAGVTGAKNLVMKGLKNVGTGIMAGSIAAGAYTAAKSISSGRPLDSGSLIRAVSKGGGIGGAIAASPLAGILGAGVGGAQAAGAAVGDFAKGIADPFKDINPTSPLNNLPSINVTYPEMDFSKLGGVLPTAPQNFIFESPSVGAGLNPSFSIGTGGGMGELLPLLLLGGGILGGFALGRKKRKKKKYKKRRRS